MNKVLIIEDDRDISNLLSIHLKDMEFTVETAFDGKDGLLKALNNEYRLIILDIMLPGEDGIEICRKIRMEKVLTPVLMLTAKTEEIDKVLGLEIGADDYLTKPFSIRELLARIKALLRRTREYSHHGENGTEKKIERKDLMIDLPKRTVEVYGKRVDLSPKEFDLLVLFSSNPGITYSRERLLSLVWGYDFHGYEHTVNSHINRLRTKIEKDPNNPDLILTTWGVGYKFRDE